MQRPRCAGNPGQSIALEAGEECMVKSQQMQEKLPTLHRKLGKQRRTRRIWKEAKRMATRVSTGEQMQSCPVG